MTGIGEGGSLLTLKLTRLNPTDPPRAPANPFKVRLTGETALVFHGMRKGEGVIKPGLLVDGWLVPGSADTAVRLEFLNRPSWPPKAGQPFPDLRLFDSKGRRVSFSSFKGKIVLVSFSAMT